ncbi:PAS domain S-box protein [Sphingomonas sinipercae]|uniref:histidine kinase n=1 Tax=Sphingomonas sinipercae TaxID=2714944 RepID=A0A6G7ZQE6_9SPHN|nr:PAS domain S-box protein [Sphingomonas sinipercae]QIL03149.1 PAS domain S-box protein [Sphingomonas sinipercae]
MNEHSDMRPASGSTTGFLDDSECGALIAARDWSDTLGPPNQWPQSLRTATALLLRSPVPMVMLWGEDGIMLYNDAYSGIAGGRHPQLLGSKVREGWPEVADFNDNVMKVGLAGGTLQYRNQELTLFRTGEAERVWMNLDYSPVIGDSGEPEGVLAIVVETTAHVLAERALREGAERLQFLDRLASEARELSDPHEIMATTARLLGQHLQVVDCAYADMEPDEDTFTIRGDWAQPGFKSIVGTYSLADFGETANRELHAGRPLITRNTLVDLGPDEAAAFLGLGLQATVCMPFIKDGNLTALMAAHDSKPRDWTDGELTLIRETTERSWAYIERTRSQAALQESEQRFRTVANSAPIMIWVTDPDGKCTYLNQRWYEFTGQEPGAGEGYGWLEAVHPDDRPRAQAAFVSANAEQRDYSTEFRVRRADGLYRWTIDAAAARFAADGTYLGYVGSVMDIDERRESEQRLKLHEEQLRLAIEAGEIGLWDFDPVHDHLFWPERVKAMFGISPDVEVSIEDFYAGVHPDDIEPTAAAFAEAADPAKRTLYDVEYRTVGKEDGVTRWVAAKGRGVFDDHGTCVRVIGTAVDITPRKKAEQHQRLLIDELSHRAKNLLAIVQSVALQSFRGTETLEEMRAAFEGRLGALGAAHDILTRQNWEAAPLSELIGATLAAVSPGDGRLLLDGPDLLLPPKTGVSLAMAIHELATNALKYGSLQSPEGKVSVTWRVSGGRLNLQWTEFGGPPVQPPSRRGFGTRMIERGLAAELGGSVRMQFEPSGVICTVDAPLPQVRP